MANNENLLKGNPTTQFKTGREQVDTAKKGGKKLGENNAKKKLYAEQLEVVIKVGTKKALELAKEAQNEQAVTMIEEGGLIAFEHLNLVMDKKVKPEVRLKALDMIIDRQEGKAIAKIEGKQVKEFSGEIEYLD